MKHSTRLENFSGLSPKRRKAVTALVSAEKTQREIAAEIGITEFTLSTWKRDDMFLKAMDEISNLAFGNAKFKALKTVINLLNSGSDTVKLNAAIYILDRTMPIKDEDPKHDAIDWAEMLRKSEELEKDEDEKDGK